MFVLRRLAVRAVQHQPARQLSSIRPVSFTSHVGVGKPSLHRLFHQSRQWLVDEEQKNTESPAEAEGGETVTAEPSAQEQNEIKEESIATAEVADAPVVNNATRMAKNAVSRATETVSNAFGNASRNAEFPPRNSPTSGEATKILYVGNLFFELTTEQLKAQFFRAGEVVNCRIVTDENGLSKGFGYVEFATQEAADKAIREFDQKPLEGRRMAVQYHMRRERGSGRGGFATRPENPPSKTLFIGNLSYQMSDRDLNDLFRDVRNVLDVRVAIDRRSGQPRGFAHADFIDVDSAMKAKEYLTNKLVYGRQLRVDFSAAITSSSSSGSYNTEE